MRNVKSVTDHVWSLLHVLNEYLQQTQRSKTAMGRYECGWMEHKAYGSKNTLQFSIAFEQHF
jgi:hypothetical protein